jgi:hypothetical protein
LRGTRGLVAFSLCAVFSACASQPVGRQDLLTFLDGDLVTRDDVYSHLGEPFAKYEHSRVVTYRLSQDKQGYFQSAPSKGWKGVQYDLVLVFDEHDRVEKHSLVSIRPVQ